MEFREELVKYKNDCNIAIEVISSDAPPFFSKMKPQGAIANKVSPESYLQPIAHIKNIANNTVNHIEKLLNYDKISHHYFSTIRIHLENVIKTLKIITGNTPTLINWYIEDVDQQISTLEKQFNDLKDNFDFFDKLNYGSQNMAIIGANGSGKTFLTDKLKTTRQGEGGLIIPAQKILALPPLSELRRVKFEIDNIKSKDQKNKTPISNYLSFNSMEFPYLIYSLIDIHSSKAWETHQNPKGKSDSILDETLKIWNELITHKQLFTNNKDKTIQVRDIQTGIIYDLHGLSDGEKVILYFIGQILGAPYDRYIIIDEPEIFIHKSILYKVWDTLEQKRSDCIFIYLTHDLDFVMSRSNTRVLWIKSFAFPSTWDIQPLDKPETTIPLDLLYSIVGSRKPILYFEGDESSMDNKLYKVLFPNFTHKPVGSCKDVINYTKATNRSLANQGIIAYGLIDRDHRSPEQISSLAEEKIFTLEYSEVENILFTEDFLRQYMKKTAVSDFKTKMQEIKEKIAEKFKAEIEILATKFIKGNIDFLFQEKNINERKDITNLKDEFNNFVSSVNIDKTYEQKKNELEGIHNYEEILKVYDNKGLIVIVHGVMNRQDFRASAINYLQKHENYKQKLANKVCPNLLCLTN